MVKRGKQYITKHCYGLWEIRRFLILFNQVILVLSLRKHLLAAIIMRKHLSIIYLFFTFSTVFFNFKDLTIKIKFKIISNITFCLHFKIYYQSTSPLLFSQLLACSILCHLPYHSWSYNRIVLRLLRRSCISPLFYYLLLLL